MNDVLSGVKHLLETRATPDNAHQTKNMHIFHTLHPTKRAKEKKPYSGPFLNAILRGGISQVVSATFRNHLQTDWNSLTANQKPLFQWFYGKLHEKNSQKRPSFLVYQFVWVTWVFRRMCWTYYRGDKFWLNFFCHRSNTEFLYEVSRHSQSKLATVHKIRIWSFLSPWRPLTFWFRLWRSS